MWRSRPHADCAARSVSAALRLLRSCAGGLVLSGAVAGCGVDRSGVGADPGAGLRLPTVELAELAGGNAVSTDTLQGAPLVINVWATWCAPCRREMPALERLSQRFAEHGVRVIGVTADRDLHLAREFVRAHGLTFSNYADGAQRTFQSSLGIIALPETLLVGADGIVLARVVGERDWDGQAAARLLETLRQRRPSAGLQAPGADFVTR